MPPYILTDFFYPDVAFTNDLPYCCFPIYTHVQYQVFSGVEAILQHMNTDCNSFNH